MFDRFLELIEQHRRFLISGHVHPDGDCIGTQVALYHFLAGMGKEVTILNTHRPEPAFDFLERHTPFGVYEVGTDLPPHEVHILTDCSTLDRLGRLGEAAARLSGITRVVVDHHVGSDRGDGDLLLWDVDAPASGAIVYDLFRKAGAPLSLAAAEGVFVSLVSDTGWFHYSNTTDETLAISADLVVQGVRPHLIYDAIHRRKRPESVALLAEGLSRAEFAAGGRVAVLGLPAAFMTRVEEHAFNTDDLLEPLRSVEGVDVVLLLKARRNGTVKVSLRASDRVDVDGIARSYGGGGHRKAAGADVQGSLDEVKDRVLADVVALVAD